MQCWLFKTEPGEYSFEHLWAEKGRRTLWDGVRNYQARNLIRDQMRVGDRVLVYHSSSTPMGVVGVAEISATARPDPTQFDARHPNADPAATAAVPIWFAVEVRATERLPRLVELAELKSNPRLARMAVVQRGSRLSVQPVTGEEFDLVLSMARQPRSGEAR